MVNQNYKVLQLSLVRGFVAFNLTVLKYQENLDHKIDVMMKDISSK